jgi:hypothetical protein
LTYNIKYGIRIESPYLETLYIMKFRQLISAAVSAGVAFSGTPALVGTTATAMLAGAALTAPAPAEAKGHKKGVIYQTFAGPRDATRTQLRAKSPKALDRKVRKFCSSSQAGDCYATDRIQRIKDGASNWDTLAPWRRYGTPSTDKNGDNLYLLPPRKLPQH